MTDDVIRGHLSGQDEGGRVFVAGVCPMLKGRLRLNAELPIPFDGWSRMELDLVSASEGGQPSG